MKVIRGEDGDCCYGQSWLVRNSVGLEGYGFFYLSRIEGWERILRALSGGFQVTIA